MNTQDIIQVKQLPVIEERLRAMRADMDGMVQEALALPCTPDTIQEVKSKRAELNKAFGELEGRRKDVKRAIMEPYNQFEAIYRDCISDRFRSADAELKGKIETVENSIKGTCEQGLREYFSELCAAEHIDFLRFEQSGVKVDMASAKQKTPKKLREQLTAFVTCVARDLEAISGLEDSEEILSEYRECLDLSAAIHTVEDRHRRIEAEKQRLQAYATARQTDNAAVEKVEQAAEVLPPPVEMPPEEKVYRCPFVAFGTKAQLKALKEFMKEKGIRYEQ